MRRRFEGRPFVVSMVTVGHPANGGWVLLSAE